MAEMKNTIEMLVATGQIRNYAPSRWARKRKSRQPRTWARNLGEMLLAVAVVAGGLLIVGWLR